jgi:tetratricopeptide (TPR) repeat protein
MTKLKVAGQEFEFLKEQKKAGDQALAIARTHEIVTTPVLVNKEEEKTKSPDSEAELNVYDYLNKGDFEKADSSFEKILNETENLIERQKLKMFYFYLKYSYAQPEALTDLINYKNTISNDPEVLSQYYHYIGRCYFRGSNYLEAVKNFEIAISQKPNIFTIEFLWEAYYFSGQKESARKFLLNQATGGDASFKAKLFAMLGDYYEKENNKLLRALAFEKAVEYEPNNLDYIFKAAYSYSEESYTLLAVNHYLFSASFKDQEYVLNNLGVALADLGFKFHSTRYYKRSSDLGNSLAASNLAYKLMEAGFEQEAMQFIDLGLSRKDPHKNLWEAKQKLNKKINDENEKLEKIKLESPEQRKFVREFASILFSEKVIEEWKFENLETSEGYKVDSSIDGAGLLILKWIDSRQVTHRVSLSGRETVSAGFCKYWTRQETSPFSPSDYKDYDKGLYYIMSEKEVMFLNYIGNSEEYKFIILIKSN